MKFIYYLYMLRSVESSLTLEFKHITNRSMLWNVLRDNYGDKHLYKFEEKFEDVINKIATLSSRFGGLIEMNKACILESSKRLQEHIKNIQEHVKNMQKRDMPDIERIRPPMDTRTASNLNKKFNKKQSEFNSAFTDETPQQLNFKVTQEHEIHEELGNLMNRQLSQRNNDIRNITKGYNRTDAENWINNEVPPPLTIDDNTRPNVKVDVIAPQKRVTFADPPPPPSFISKLKRKATDTSQSATPANIKTILVTPDKVENNIFYFNDIAASATSFCMSKVFLFNSTIVNINALNQRIIKKISDDPYLFCKININRRINKKNILLVQKYHHGDDVYFASDEKISVSKNIRELEVTFYNRNNEQLGLMPILDIAYFIKGSELHIKGEKNLPFFDNKYRYIILNNNELLLVGEKILINNDLVTILGTCSLTIQDNYYHLENVDIGKKHNCSIVEWGIDIRGQTPTIYRAPTCQFTIMS